MRAPGLRELALAPAGVVAAHGLSYLLAHPDHPERGEGLAGHSHLTPLTWVSLALAVAVLGWVLAADRRGTRLQVAWRRLAVYELVAFVGLEVGERLALGEGLQAVAAEPAVWLGGVCAVPTARALTALVRWVPALSLPAPPAGAGVWPAVDVSTAPAPGRPPPVRVIRVASSPYVLRAPPAAR
ncbi:MAG: hypothetical protein M3N17_01405 [Actinomycetota bacterium]|nr:hypothetical protein [Actinomycetota bacterium]